MAVDETAKCQKESICEGSATGNSDNMKHIKEQAEKEGRYGKRAKEVAARTVMKHHKQKAHRKGQWAP